MYYVYLLKEKKTGKHYIGYTADLKRRLSEHNKKHIGYTNKGDWELIYYESYKSKDDAIL